MLQNQRNIVFAIGKIERKWFVFMELHEAKISTITLQMNMFQQQFHMVYTKNYMWDSFFALTNYQNGKFLDLSLDSILVPCIGISKGCLHPILTFPYLNYTSTKQTFVSKNGYDFITLR